MKVIIAGAGEIGWYVAEQVSAAGHDVTLIDNDDDKVRHVAETLDVRAMLGSAGSARTLLEAGVVEADLLLAVTGSDETNIVCASVGGKLGAAMTRARVDEVTYRKAPEISYHDHFAIDELVSPQMLTALELASMVRNPELLAVEHFARGALEMQQFVADEGAENVGKPLHEVKLTGDVRVGSIKRGDELIIPGGGDHVAHDDLITLVGHTEHVAEARRTFEAAQSRMQRVVIMGGGHIATSLARRLRRETFPLTIIERDARRCEFMAERFSHATVLHGDGTDLSFLQEERIEKADVFVSTTASDEANIMSAMQARHLGVKQVYVVIHRPDYADLVEQMGIDRAISPRVVLTREVLASLHKEKVATLAEIDGRAEVLELAVEGEDFVGQQLRDIKLPGASLILALQREDQVITPDGDTIFQLGEKVLVICLKERRKEVERFIMG